LYHLVAVLAAFQAEIPTLVGLRVNLLLSLMGMRARHAMLLSPLAMVWGCSLFFDYDNRLDGQPDASTPPAVDAGRQEDVALDHFVSEDAGDPPLRGLTVDTSNPSKVVIEHPGRFRMTYSEAKRWQLDTWEELRHSPGIVFSAGGDRATLSAWETTLEGAPCSHRSQTGAPPIVLRYTSATVALFDTVYDCGSAGGPRLVATTNHTVWASGRAQVFTSIYLDSGVLTRDNGLLTYGVLTLPANGGGWDAIGQSANKGIVLKRNGSRTSLALLQPAPDSTDLFVDEGTLPPRHFFRKFPAAPRLTSTRVFGQAEFLVGQDLDQASLDGRNQERALLALESPVNITGVSFQANSGDYLMSRTTPGVASFVLPGAVPHYEPAFTMQNWTEATYTVRRNGVVVASDQRPIGTDVVTSYDASGKILYMQDVSTFPRQANGTAYSVTP
jgi:hypothetical protein